LKTCNSIYTLNCTLKTVKTAINIFNCIVDIERQISLRSTRDELIKRGILKEINDNTPALAPTELTITEEPEEINSNGNYK